MHYKICSSIDRHMKRILLILTLFAFAVSGCESPNVLVGTDVNEGTVILNIGETLILTEYIEFDEKVQDMAMVLGRFAENRTQANLDSARQSWLDAHAVWCRTEAFVFGPAALKNAEEQVDFFPVDPTDIRYKIASIPVFTPDRVVGFSGSLKGFHLIEYLLWDSGGTKQPADFTDKEISYMRYVSDNIWDVSHALYLEWDPSRGNYLKHFREAGTGTSDYTSQKDALKAMLNSMIRACRELADVKLGGPLVDPRYEESRFSGTTAIDYQNTLTGVRNVYLGGQTETGLSIASLIHGTTDGYLLDTRIREEFTNAMTKLSALHPFASTLASNRDAIIAAQNAVRTLEDSFEGVIGVLGL